MRRRAWRHRLLGAAGAAVATASVLATTSPGTATAAPPPKVLHNSAAPALAPGTRVLGALAGSTPVPVDVTLQVRDAAGLHALLAGLHDPKSPLYHRFLTPAQFAERFGAPHSELVAVEQWLRSIGVTPTSVAQNRLAIHARGPAASLATGLRTSFLSVRTPQGRPAYANETAPSIPAALAADVTGIVGLNSLPLAHSELVHETAARAPHRVATTSATGSVAGPKACNSAKAAANSFGSFTAPGLASYYDFAALYTMSDRGAGVSIGVAEFEPDASADIRTFQGCYHTAATVNYTAISDGTNDGVGTGGVITNDPGSGEAALDIENVISIAPRATIGVYQTPNTDLGDLNMYAQMVTDDMKVITTSWGSCEPETTPAVLTAEQTTFQEANVLGDVIFAAAGDSGSTDCFPHQDGFPPTDDATLTVDDPGSQPYVVSVGGTTATRRGEVVWNDQSGGAGGGGISTVHCMPAYQDNAKVVGLVNPYTHANPVACPTSPSYLRQVPDVSAIADPNTGYTIFWSGNWGAIGGTSGSAPLWAGASALVLSSPYCKAFGSVNAVSPQGLYGLAAVHAYDKSALFDVTRGNNAVSASGYLGSLYPARTGYDQASGLGTPSLTYYTGSATPDLFHPGLASLLCYTARSPSVALAPTVSRVVPDHAASGRPTTVTVVGAGFLAIPGADHVQIDGKTLPASCSTPARCRVVLPALPAATVHLRVLVQTYAKTPASSADLVTFVRAPRVTRISPGTARPAGATRVTIRGAGFTGSVRVFFGAKRASHLRVVSATELIVTAPGGTGSAYVTVSAQGGRSAASAAGLYRF